MPEERFDVSHVEALTHAFRAQQVDFLIMGKGAAIIMGYPATTLDVDLFLPKSPQNGAKVVSALQSLGFPLTENQMSEIVRGKDFVQLNGPFRLDLVHAPDGLPDYETVKRRSVTIDQYPLVSLRDIIASKEAAGRIKDQMDLALLKAFQEVFEQEQLRQRMENLEQQQQQQQTVSDGSSNQASQTISPDVPNAAAQAELLRAEQLSLQHNGQLALYAQAKAQQIDNPQASLQSAIHSQATKLAAIEQERPAWPVTKQARASWNDQIAQAKARLAQLERRSERVGEIARDAGLYADSLLEELAARKLRFHHPDLARQWDALQQQQRKAALQKLQASQTVELDVGRTRSLTFSSDS